MQHRGESFGGGPKIEIEGVGGAACPPRRRPRGASRMPRVASRMMRGASHPGIGVGVSEGVGRRGDGVEILVGDAKQVSFKSGGRPLDMALGDAVEGTPNNVCGFAGEDKGFDKKKHEVMTPRGLGRLLRECDRFVEGGGVGGCGACCEKEEEMTKLKAEKEREVMRLRGACGVMWMLLVAKDAGGTEDGPLDREGGASCGESRSMSLEENQVVVAMSDQEGEGGGLSRRCCWKRKESSSKRWKGKMRLVLG